MQVNKENAKRYDAISLIMAIPVMEFQVRGYKNGNIFAQKSTYPTEIIGFLELVKWRAVKNCASFW